MVATMFVQYHLMEFQAIIQIFLKDRFFVLHMEYRDKK
jgi:hypothetical protein